MLPTGEASFDKCNRLRQFSMNQQKQFKVLSQKLLELGFASYKEYLLSPHWSALRRRFFNKHRSPPCSGCWKTTVPLQLHHRNYNRIGRERLSDLVALCGNCHRKTHDFCRANTQYDFHSAHRQSRRWAGSLTAGQISKGAT